MSEVDRLVYAIVRFLDEQSKSASEETAESLEVARQCIETAYGITLEDGDKYPMPAPLQEIFAQGVLSCGASSQDNNITTEQKLSSEPTVISPEDKALAEKFKTEGNDFMKAEKYEEALGHYTKAIANDASNAVYYCNRAAAYSKLDKHQEALEDCEEALNIDPNYSKAYGRKGLAHSALGQHPEAVNCYRTALHMDPGNASYQQNMDIAEQKVREAPAAGGMGGLGNMDFTALLGNPAVMNMATSMMSNPEMQNMMSGFMSGQQNVSGGEGFSNLLQAGQRLAQQMQQANPELVDQLRTRMEPPQPDEDGTN